MQNVDGENDDGACCLVARFTLYLSSIANSFAFVAFRNRS